MSLTSVTLTVDLVKGRREMCQKQWVLNLALLAVIPAEHLRRVQFCIILNDEHHDDLCGDALEQVKQIRWIAVRDAIARFPGLEQIVLITHGADEWVGNHIWQEIEALLRPLRLNGRRSLVVRRSFCFV